METPTLDAEIIFSSNAGSATHLVSKHLLSTALFSSSKFIALFSISFKTTDWTEWLSENLLSDNICTSFEVRVSSFCPKTSDAVSSSAAFNFSSNFVLSKAESEE
jgi:hypothetical protein